MFADAIRELTASTGTGPLALAGALAGHRTISSAYAVGAPVPYVVRNGSQMEVGVGALSSSTILTRGNISYSTNANALVNFTGVSEVYVSPSADFFNAANVWSARQRTSGQRDLGAPTSPSGVQIGAIKTTLSNHPLLLAAFADFEASLDVGILSGQAMHWGSAFGLNNVLPINAPVLTSTGTLTSRFIVLDSDVGMLPRVGLVSAASAGSLSGARHNSQTLLPGRTTRGGYLSVFRFATSDAAVVSGARAFYGLRSTVAAPSDVEPDTLTHSIGVGQLSTDSTQLYLIASGSSAQSPVALGTDYPPMAATGATGGPPYELAVLCTRNMDQYWSLRRFDSLLTTGGQLTGTIGTQRPSSSQTMAVNSYRSNNATALAVGFDVIGWSGWNFFN